MSALTIQLATDWRPTPCESATRVARGPSSAMPARCAARLVMVVTEAPLSIMAIRRLPLMCTKKWGLGVSSSCPRNGITLAFSSQ